MNLYILFLISLPEAVLNLYIILQLAGKNEFLDYRNKKCIFRFIAALVLMLTASLFIRPLAPNVIINMLFHSIVYAVILCFIYRTSVIKSVFCVSLVFMLNSAIENIYIPFIAVYASGGYDIFLSKYHLFVIYAIPYRLAQIGVIMWLKKYDIVFDLIKLNRTFNKIFIVFMYALITLGFGFANIYYTYFSKMTLMYQIVFALSISVMVFMTCVLVFNLIYIAVKGILTGGYKQYQRLENDTSNVLNEVYTLVKYNNSEGAKKLLEGFLKENVKK